MKLNSYSQLLDSEYNTAPIHESMRKSSDYDYWGDGRYDKDSYHYISRLLDSSIGKNFDKVFSDVCNRFRKKKNYEFRRVFLDRIDPTYNPSNEGYRGKRYYLDKDKNIRRYKVVNRRRKNIKIKTVDRPIEYFTIKMNVFKKYPGVLDLVSKYLGPTLFSRLLKDKLPMRYYSVLVPYISRALDSLYPVKYKYISQKNPNDFLHKLDDSEYVTYYEGDHKFYKYMAETKDASRKAYREKKLKREKYLSSLLSLIEAERKSKCE